MPKMKTRYFGPGEGCIDPGSAFDITVQKMIMISPLRVSNASPQFVFNFPEKSDQTRFGDLEPEVKDPADL